MGGWSKRSFIHRKSDQDSVELVGKFETDDCSTKALHTGHNGNGKEKYQAEAGTGDVRSTDDRPPSRLIPETGILVKNDVKVISES